jgi:hypothetical protein
VAAVSTAAQTSAATLPAAAQKFALQQSSLDLGNEIMQLQAELERSAQLAGLKNDPTWPLVKALSTSLGLQWRLHEQGVRYFHDASERLDRQFADTIAQAEQALETRRMAVIEGLVPILVDLTTKNARAWRRTVTLKTAFSFGAFAIVLAFGVGMAGYGAGWESGHVFAVEISGELATVVRNAGPAAENALAAMIHANDLAEAWARCQKMASTDKNGRRVCAMPMWVDPEGPPTGGV